MSVVDVVFGEDMVLDEEAFEKAARQFADLSVQLQQLRTGLEDMLLQLKQGFDTPAGRKFVVSCEKNLFKPLDDQKLVLDHISAALLDSKQAYGAVFREYEELHAAIYERDS